MNSMADNQKVYQAIKTIADELCKENKTYLRADLAFELKKYGIASDSSEVSKLVFDAYRYFHDNGNIAIAFVSNNSRTTLVAEYKLNDSLEQGNKEEALKIAETELALSSSALEQLKEQVELNLNLVLAKGTSKMADIVMGTNGVKDVRSKAATMFDKYTKMVEAYHYAEDSVRGNIEDFTSLRSDIGTVYRDYALKLIDIYGDSIKMVSPDLFDFKRIEWLDVDEMLKYVELEYNKLTEKCTALIGEISDSFRTSLQGSLQAYKSLSNGNKSLGLAMAGLTMLEHYMGAGTSAEEFFLKSINVESIFEFVERTDYLFLYSIKECVEKSDCHEGVYLSEVAEYMKLSIPETSKMVKSLENKGYIIWKLDEKKERTYLVLTNKAIELSNCQKEKMIEAYEKIISNIQEDDLAVTRCTLRKIRQLMEEIK